MYIHIDVHTGAAGLHLGQAAESSNATAQQTKGPSDSS